VSSISYDCVNTWGKETDRPRPSPVGSLGRSGEGGKEDQRDGDWSQETAAEMRAAGQTEAKLILTDCLNERPLLSVHTIVSGASLSALSVKLTTGSRLIPEVHSKRATSSPA
jgi:hypothetical protein